VKLWGVEAPNPPRNEGAAWAEKPPRDPERWAQMERVRPVTNSANAGKRFMELVYACSCIGVASLPKNCHFHGYTLGGCLTVLLTAWFWEWSGLAALGMLYLIFIAPHSPHGWLGNFAYNALSRNFMRARFTYASHTPVSSSSVFLGRTSRRDPGTRSPNSSELIFLQNESLLLQGCRPHSFGINPNLRVAVSIGRIGKFERYKYVMIGGGNIADLL
jgi:hypothetical protein